jgi:23S rRNA pseudouridine2457 synthase
VRRLTAAIGHPTLRLLRVRVGAFELSDLPPGQWRELTPGERQLVLRSSGGTERATLPGAQRS